ncbi:acyl-CoA synthetase [Candidatus Contendibacter odensensis]|uniref:AMP-dependent synthetase and ligase n=1 Tax=Candidatus Contendobacter odensis Run_B_J11 TaxID=1400861 RepID=A0A7U7GG61_9GAMM|nr:acyl-CoA synthetase [Candidatus Contendobacter odensis]CDH47524.1 putative AMP-dependent synthetase and ligase [Candidatus Contendobacter odensis Run_B_J11]
MNTHSQTAYEVGLGKNAANFVALTPLTFIERAASVYPNHIAVVHGSTRRSWAQTYTRCRRLASALRQRGIGLGDTVAAMLPNIPEMFELHFGIPMTGAVLNTLNMRLDAETIAFMLEHGEAKVLITDREFSETISKALRLIQIQKRPLVIDVDDPQFVGGEKLGGLDYETLLAEGDPEFAWQPPADEWQAISLNYTSGTTGNPKGVVYHHRGAYLNAICNAMVWDMGLHPVYLWTLPMFHCNGWCFPWTLAAAVGTNICLRQVRADLVFDLIRQEQVNHFCGAPIVLNLLKNAPDSLKAGISHVVKVMTAGAAPPAAVIEGMERMNFDVTHTYGLTETYGPAVVCAWHDHWNELPLEQRAALKSRQGVRYPMLEGLMVANATTLEPVSQDGKTIGEIFMRGNNVMKGYLKNPAASEEAFAGGWFHSGDLAVWHEDGYIDIKDRSKDIIISGGENISTIEVEDVLYRHPAVMEVAVVARPDEKWGETPCAFVTLKSGMEHVTEEEIIGFCRTQLARFKVPKTVIFGPLPKTSTGKMQKYILREQAKQL